MSQTRSLARSLRWPLRLLGLLAVLASVACWLLLPTDPIGLRAFDRIQLGMTEEEVEAVVGLPARKYHPKYELMDYIDQLLRARPRPIAEKGKLESTSEFWLPARRHWRGSSYLIEVALNEDQKAIAASLYELPAESPSYLERLRAWLGL